MIIVKDQWTAIVANFVRQSSNSFKENYYLCNDRQRQKKLASIILYTKHMFKSKTLNDIFNSKVVALYNIYNSVAFICFERFRFFQSKTGFSLFTHTSFSVLMKSSNGTADF